MILDLKNAYNLGSKDFHCYFGVSIQSYYKYASAVMLVISFDSIYLEQITIFLSRGFRDRFFLHFFMIIKNGSRI